MSVVRISQSHGRKPVTILHLLDRINMGNVGQLEQAARDAYNGGARYFVIDMTYVLSITSAGLRAILSIYKLLGSESSNHSDVGSVSGSSGPPSKSAYLKLFNASPDVRKVLKIAGFDEYLEIYNSQEEAISSF